MWRPPHRRYSASVHVCRNAVVTEVPVRSVAGGLSKGERSLIDEVSADLESGTQDSKRRTDLFRALLRLQHTVAERTIPTVAGAKRDPHLVRLDHLAGVALAELGAEADPSWWSLADYDAATYGPLFGVSDDGDAAAEITRALLDSPKSQVLRGLGRLSLETIGACVDAERMSAAGELPVAISEYVSVRAAVVGRVPMTTNVGTVVLPRFYRTRPFVVYRANARPDPATAMARDLAVALQPYRDPPGGGDPRSVVAYVAFRGGDRVSRSRKVEVLRDLGGVLDQGEIGDPTIHRIGLLQRARDRGSAAPILAIDIAADAGLTDVLIEGDARFESQDQLLLPGLLAFFPPRRANEILAHARKRGVHVEPKNSIDLTTAWRTIWVGLTTARGMGCHLGKYGLFPLTVEEQLTTIRSVQERFPHWTATPAFYVDRPVVTASGVREERDVVDPLLELVAAAASAGVRVALVDSPDRTPLPAGSGLTPYHEDRGRRLIKRDPTDRAGVFTMDDIDRVRGANQAGDRPIGLMWAGGIDGRQAWELARRKEFGIFTTSSTARRVAVAGGPGDPSVTSEMEPTYFGVLGVRMVIEAGFLSAVAAQRGDTARERELVHAVEPVLQALEQGLLTTVAQKDRVPALDGLAAVLLRAWEEHLSAPSAAP